MVEIFRGCASLAKYCAKKLPLTTEVLAIHNGKIVFRRCSTSNLPGCGTDPRPSIYLSGTPSFKLSGTPTFKDGQSEFGDSEMSEIGRNSHEGIQSFEDGRREDSAYRKDEELGSFERRKKSLSAVSTSVDLVQQRPGWPLLRAASTTSTPVQEARKMSVVSWVMSLPNRSSPGTPGSNSSVDSIKMEYFLGRESSNLSNKGDSDDNSKGSCELPEALELLKTHSSGCRWFSYEVLKASTSHFSSGYISTEFYLHSLYQTQQTPQTPLPKLCFYYRMSNRKRRV